MKLSRTLLCNSFLLVCCSLSKSKILSSPEIIGTHDLGWNTNGQLAFTQLGSEERIERVEGMTGHTVLFPVEVNFDMEEMSPGGGITMNFDKQHHRLRLDTGVQTIGSIAWGTYADTIDSNGWSELVLTATPSRDVSNDVRMYSAGWIEGILTCVRTSQHYANYFELIKVADTSSHAVNRIKGLFQNQIAFMRANANLVPHIMTEEPAEDYQKHSRYILFQLWGMVDGYNFAAKHFNIHSLDFLDFMLLNHAAEMPALMKAYGPQAAADRAAQASAGPLSFLQKGRRNASTSAALGDLDDASWRRRLEKDGHCSALIRVTANNGDLLTGHTTWSDYSTMLRIYKYYNFPLWSSGTMSHSVAFSSYPGVMSSPDSYYIMDSGLVVMDTSLEILDIFIWEKVKEFGILAVVPNWVHIIITNRMARSGTDWARKFDTVNTGTYNSQWMVVDYNQFVAGEQVRDNTLWLIETIPGKTHKADISHFLRDFGYFPSFNRPYFDVIRDLTGFTGAQSSAGDLYSWTNNPRARIFRGASGAVNSLFDMRNLMNRNLFPFEGVGELSLADPGHAVSARNDLAPSQAIPNGGIDAKLTNRCLMRNLMVQAQSGPTHATQPVFKWKDAGGRELFPGQPHKGQPTVWNFGYVQITPSGFGGLNDITGCSK